MRALDLHEQPGSVVLSWRVRQQPPVTVVELSGELNEDAELERLRQGLRGPVVLHMAGVKRINSGGVREWVNFIDVLSANHEVTLTHCSPAVVAQLNMIFNFCGRARIASFLAPYACSRCDREEELLIELAHHLLDRETSSMPPFPCNSCGSPMDFDEIVDRYLSFLQQD